MDIVNKYLLDERNFVSGGRDGRHCIVKEMECVDGFKMSVQASGGHYCSPRAGNGPWHEVEVGYPSEVEMLLLPRAEDPEEPKSTVYGYVPVEIVIAVIEKHGGLK